MEKFNPIDRLSILMGEKLSIVFLVSVIITAYEVFMRYGLNAPTIWVHDSAAALSATGFIMSGAYALQQDRHMRISVVYDIAPSEIKKILDLLNSIIIIAFLVLLTYTTIDQAIPSLEVMETSAHAWDVPIPAYLKALMVVGSAAMLAQSLVQFWAQVRRWV